MLELIFPLVLVFRGLAQKRKSTSKAEKASKRRSGSNHRSSANVVQENADVAAAESEDELALGVISHVHVAAVPSTAVSHKGADGIGAVRTAKRQKSVGDEATKAVVLIRSASSKRTASDSTEEHGREPLNVGILDAPLRKTSRARTRHLRSSSSPEVQDPPDQPNNNTREEETEVEEPALDGGGDQDSPIVADNEPAVSSKRKKARPSKRQRAIVQSPDHREEKETAEERSAKVVVHTGSEAEEDGDGEGDVVVALKDDQPCGDDASKTKVEGAEEDKVLLLHAPDIASG
jgi:hypothetical protein